jgi:two-component system chemotaxis response regulator CheY
MTNVAKRILIVDDTEAMRKILRTMLRGEEYDVVGEARDGEQAIEMAQLLRPEIVFLDIEMPKMGGLEALGEIRRLLPETIVLMVTSHTQRDMVQSAIAGGAVGYIVKPFSASRVIAAIRAAVAKQTQSGGDAAQTSPQEQ